jgi:hypothetical protein
MIHLTYEYRCDICAQKFGENKFRMRSDMEVPRPLTTSMVGDLTVCQPCMKLVLEAVSDIAKERREKREERSRDLCGND